MKENALRKGASMFARSSHLIDNDPLEEIFALNLGEFLTEHLISDELAEKISSKAGDRAFALKNQLKELISIYSIDNTLSVLGFNNKEDYIIYNSIAKTIIQMLDVDRCHIFLTKENAKGLEHAGKDLILVGSSLEFDDDIYSYNIGYKFSDSDIAVKAFLSKETIVPQVVALEQDFHPIDKLLENETRLYAVVPMHNNDLAVGIIVIENNTEKVISEECLTLLEDTARLFATSIHLQKLTESTGKVLEDAEESSLSRLQHLRAELTAVIGDLGDDQQMFVEQLANAVDAKGKYKNNHSKMVAALAREICTALELNEKTKDLIYYAGLLQNIGKITLPEELFDKKGNLTSEDWDKLQNHPNVGVNLLMSINFLSEVIPYIHYHKERWDGKGVPEGLKANSIPLGSRIIAVADAYTAMTAERSYREAMDASKALDIIKEESGIKWDPVVVDALFRIKSKTEN